VSSLYIDNATGIFQAYQKPIKRPVMKTLDARTIAFREWIATILTKNSINKSELARRAGLSHSTLSRATTDDGYKINFRTDTIWRLAEVGGIKPPAIVAGEKTETHGMSEPEATPYLGQQLRNLTDSQTIWTASTNILASVGLLPGDKFILDQSLKPRGHDVIMVQNYDHQSGTAETMLRIYDGGFAVSPLYLVDRSPKLWIDGNNVAVMGVVIESWRTRD
jgi:transcriptional regulator with XRE-family HTH domain